MFTELTANILYLNLCAFACVYIGACTVCSSSMWLRVLAEGSKRVSFFFNLSLSISHLDRLFIHISSQLPHNLAQLCCLVYKKLWKSYMLRFTLLAHKCWQIAAFRCFGGVKNVCMPASLCIFKGLSFVG